MSRALLVVVVMAAAALAGCASDEGGEPTPMPEPEREPAVERIPVDFTGNTGDYLCAGVGIAACIPQVIILTAANGGFEEEGNGREVAANLTMTWQGNSPGTSTMALRLYTEAADGSRTGDGALFDVSGGPPLTLEEDWTPLPDNTTQLQISTAISGTFVGPILLVAALDEEIHIEGEIRVRSMIVAETIEAPA